MTYRCLTIYVKELKWASHFRSLLTYALSIIPALIDSVPGLYASYVATTVNKKEFIYIHRGVVELHDLLLCQCTSAYCYGCEKAPQGWTSDIAYR